MLKPTVKRGLMLSFIPNEISCPAQINPNRLIKLNNNRINDGDIVYVMSRELRLEDNWAALFGLELAKEYNKNFRLIINLPEHSNQQEKFLADGLIYLKKNLEFNNINYEISDNIPYKAGAIIFDFNPLVNIIDNLKKINCAAFEVDSHNIIPARFVSQKQEYSAATLRRKVYANLANFLTEYPKLFKNYGLNTTQKLDEFIRYKLDFYNETKNNPNNDVTSGLSPYLHFGFISAQRIALEIIQSSTNAENKEAFLEELIIRKELSDNFCLYCTDFKSFDCVPNWAKDTLDFHKNDIRAYVYNKKEFEYSKTHDKNWNKIQDGLVRNGRIHGYLRMYWAKKILEWSKSPLYALETAIYLNDKYALDGNDPNGYVGILWSIGGLHDRPFTNRFVTGKIRYMSVNKKNKSYFEG